MSELTSRLDAIVEQIESARAMPLSASCVVNRAELLADLEQLRELLPKEVAEAREVIDSREDVIAAARVEADAILAEAKTERARMVARTEIVQHARAESERLLTEARDTGDLMRREVDDYVDAKLANFEVVLHKTLTAVERGREKLRGRSELDALASPDDGEASPADDPDEFAGSAVAGPEADPPTAGRRASSGASAGGRARPTAERTKGRPPAKSAEPVGIR